MTFDVCRSLHRHLRDHPAYEKYPKYALFLAALTWIDGRIHCDWEYEQIVAFPLFETIWWLSLFLPAYIAMTLGAIGLHRHGKWNRFMSIAAIVLPLADPSARFFLSIHVLSYIKWAAWVVFFFIWHFPASLLHDVFAGDPMFILPLWCAYLTGLYLVLRVVALRAWGRYEGRVVALPNWLKRRTDPREIISHRKANQVAVPTK